MSIVKYFLRLQYIDFLVRKKATGDKDTFAKKNHLSKSGLAVVIKDMQEMGFPIKYNKNRKSYYYEKDGQMAQRLFIEDGKTLTRDNLKQLKLDDIENLCFSEVSIFEPCGNF
jgi:hypothetical protein